LTINFTTPIPSPRKNHNEIVFENSFARKRWNTIKIIFQDLSFTLNKKSISNKLLMD